MNRSALALVAVTLLATVGMSLHSQAQTQNQPPSPARSRSDEMLERWNDIGNKLIAMAQDFPEDKYDFKVQKDERTFALNLLHAAALDFVLVDGEQQRMPMCRCCTMHSICSISMATTGGAFRLRSARRNCSRGSFKEIRSASPITCSIFSVVSARMSDAFETSSAWGNPASSSSLLAVSIRKRAAIIEEETSSWKVLMTRLRSSSRPTFRPCSNCTVEESKTSSIT